MRKFAPFLFVFCSYIAGAQKPFIRDFSLSETNTGVKINAMAQDATGYIWLATDAGLLRFNGHSFIKILDSMHKPATAVAVSGPDVWTAYGNGQIGQVVNLSVSADNIINGPSSTVTSLTSGGAGLLFATTEEQGVFAIMDKVGINLNASNGLSDNFTYGVSQVSNERLLVGSDVGINDVSFSNKPTVDICTTRQGLPDNIVTVIRPVPNTPFCLIGTQQGGVVIYDRDKKTIKTKPAPVGAWIYGQVNDILPMSRSRAWVATEDGYLIELGLTNDSISSLQAYQYEGRNFKKLLCDKAGNIWCGTSQGLSLFTGEYVSGVPLGGPYSLSGVTAMLWDDNAILVALRQSLYKVFLKGSTPLLVPVFKARAPITSLFKDTAGRIWVGTLGDGLYYGKIGSGLVKATGMIEPAADASILNITGTKNSLWVAGLKGVEELSYPVDGKLTALRHHGKKSGIGSDYVYQIFADHNDNVWMATDGAGICMYNGSEYQHWNNAFGQNSKVAYSIAEDIFGDIWAGTMYKDLYHFHNDKWENLRLPETQYPDINISSVAANATGQVISVYQRCIDVWYPGSHYFRHFNSALGIGIDSTSNVLNCIAKDASGNVYVPYQHGILVFRNQPEPFDIRPSVHINYPSIFSRPVSNEKHRFDHDENYIGFTFDGVGYANYERLNYRYTLQGYNDGWIYTNDASVSFPKLSPGNYKLRVQVSLNPAFEHPNEDDYSFSIAAPYWKTNWFYASGTFFILLLGYSYIKIREKRLKRLSKLQHERMIFEYEHLKSQVNPHFLFNSLYALSILIEEKKENALAYTVNLADLYRNMLSYSRNDVISLKEEIDILNAYIHIQQTRFGDALSVKIDIPAETIATRKVVPLALQLLVENAIKHNVVSLAQPLHITITATHDEVIVRNFIQMKISKEKGAGIGIVNIQQRYKQVTKKPVTFGVFGNEYIVKLPLL